MATIKVKLDEGAVMPVRAHDTDVGYDIRALTVQVKSTQQNAAGTCLRPYCYVCDTGVHIEPEEGYYVEVVPNSRTAKTNYIYGNAIGIIDPDYRGSIKVVFNVIGDETNDAIGKPEPGSVVGQLIVRKREDACFEETDSLSDTVRGAGGFGSTEKKQTDNS